MSNNFDDSALFLYTLNLHNFRNYSSLRLETQQKSVIITGQNGVGKTNILEAISLLVPGKGLRSAPIDDYQNAQQGNNDWAVSADAHSKVGLSTLGIGANTEINTKKRFVRINNTKSKQTQLSEYMACIWLTPQMDRIFSEGIHTRRRFIDRLVLGFDIKHAGRVSGYEKAVRQRNILLKNPPYDSVWLSAIEKDIAQRAIAITAARQLLCDRLNTLIHDGYPPFPGANIVLQGDVETIASLNSPSQAEDIVCKTLYNNRQTDAKNGTTQIGVHKTDVVVTHLGKNIPVSLCSTGEQKAVIIAIILGAILLQKAETGYCPIVLLDEITAHLDCEKRIALFNAIKDLSIQVWYTGTNIVDFEEIAHTHTVLHIENNTIFPQ